MAFNAFGYLVHSRRLLLALLVLEEPRDAGANALSQRSRFIGAVLDLRVGLVLSRSSEKIFHRH